MSFRAIYAGLLQHKSDALKVFYWCYQTTATEWQLRFSKDGKGTPFDDVKLTSDFIFQQLQWSESLQHAVGDFIGNDRKLDLRRLKLWHEVEDELFKHWKDWPERDDWLSDFPSYLIGSTLPGSAIPVDASHIETLRMRVVDGVRTEPKRYGCSLTETLTYFLLGLLEEDCDPVVDWIESCFYFRGFRVCREAVKSVLSTKQPASVNAKWLADLPIRFRDEDYNSRTGDDWMLINILGGKMRSFRPELNEFIRQREPLLDVYDCPERLAMASSGKFIRIPGEGPDDDDAEEDDDEYRAESGGSELSSSSPTIEGSSLKRSSTDSEDEVIDGAKRQKCSFWA